MNQVEYQFAPKSGIEYLEKKGEGTPFLLLHGISSGAYSWIKQLQDREISAHLIAWNAPGYGKSEKLMTDTPLALDYADRLFALINELGLERIILVGHSLGAMMVTAFAAKYPQYLERVQLIAPAQGYAKEEESVKAEVYQRRPKLLARLGNLGMAEERGSYLLGNPSAENMDIVREVSQRLTMDGFTNASHLLAYDSIDRALSQIDPQLEIDLYFGLKDGITPPEGMHALKARHSRLNLVEVADAGHLAYIDAPLFFKERLFGPI